LKKEKIAQFKKKIRIKLIKKITNIKTELNTQDALSTYKNIPRTIRTYHYDHWSAETHIDKWNDTCKR